MAKTARTTISINDSFALIFNAVKGYDCELIPNSEYGEDFKDFFIIKFVDQSKNNLFIAFIKQLTPSSRNPESEYSFQIIETQRDRMLELAKKLKADTLYIGWSQDKECMLVPCSDKVTTSANQGSVFMNLEVLEKYKAELQSGVYLKNISKEENLWSHTFLDHNFGAYLNLIQKGLLDPKTGSSPQVSENEGIVKFEEKPATSIVGQKKAQKTKPKFSGSAHNVILYGPPGTGKTMAAVLIAQDIIKGNTPDLDSNTLNFREYPKDFFSEFGLNYYGTQFHPSFSYEDFFEGLRPVQIQGVDKGEVSYLVIPGVFKVICQLSRAYLEKGEYGIDLSIQFIKGAGAIKDKWQIGEHSIVGLYSFENRPGYLTYNDKTVLLTGGYAGATTADVEPDSSGVVQAKWFYAGESEPVNFVLFVDELNRGNPAKIFGEALSLIEDTKRYGRREQAEITLPYSREKFVVPPNVHILCSMNSSDKSLTNLDQAFRRRFDFVYFPPAFEIITTPAFKKLSKEYFSDGVLRSLKNHFEVINRSLNATGVSQENHIGHSYLLKLLRNSFFEIENAKTKPNVEEVVRANLMKIWKSELHSQIREIVGEHRINDFSSNFAAEAEKVKGDDIFLVSYDDISKTVKKYLEDIQPLGTNFPWKKAA